VPPRPPAAGGRQPPSSGAFLWGLGGGVLGGIVAALATIYLLPPPGADDLTALRGEVRDQAQTVEQVQGRIEELTTGAAGQADLPGRLEALEGGEASMRERVAALETAAGAAPEQDAVAAQIATLEAGLAAIEDKVETLSASGTGGGDAQQGVALETELSSLSATVARLQESGAAAPTSDQITDLQQGLDRVAQAADRIAALSAKVDALSGQVEDNEQRVEDVATDAAATGGQVKLLDERAETLAGDVGALQSRIAVVEEEVKTATDRRGRAATLALLTGQLELAIDQAQPYDASLESLRAFGAEDAVVGDATAQLEPSAATGVPSLAQLRRSFEDTANDIVHAGRAPEGDGMLDRAAGNLMRLVTVRPVGADAEGDDADARVARAEAKLAAGDLARAVAELDGLEGAAAEAAAPWLEQARARLAAKKALDDLNTHTAGLLATPQ
jgi:hypothetical protein